MATIHITINIPQGLQDASTYATRLAGLDLGLNDFLEDKLDLGALPAPTVTNPDPGETMRLVWDITTTAEFDALFPTNAQKMAALRGVLEAALVRKVPTTLKSSTITVS